MYPINVANDLLLIYNTNSTESATVLNYYLTHRPLVGGANVLPIGCTTNETIQPSEFTNSFIPQIQNWLTNNPTKRPQYVILFVNIPSRVNIINTPGYYDEVYEEPSVQYQINQGGCLLSWQPFVTSLNMNGLNGTNDCIAYIKKLISIGTNYMPGNVLLSGRRYGNTNYYFDDTECCYGDYPIGGAASQAVIQAGVSPFSVVYTNMYPDFDAGPCTNHITRGTNVAGYMSWGEHSSLGEYYATNGYVSWSGNSGWYLMETIESFNGERDTQATEQGNFLQWFSSNAFAGTNYSNTPIGAVSNVDEPGRPDTSYGAIYFGLWASGKNSSICAWNAINSHEFQMLGDPFVIK